MTPDTPESLRAEAVECGKRANAYLVLKDREAAKAEISKAHQLVMAAMEMELTADPSSLRAASTSGRT